MSSETPTPVLTPAAGGGGETRPGRWPRVLLRMSAISSLWLVVSLLHALQIAGVGLLPWRSAFVLGLLDWGPWVLCTPLVIAWARRVPINPSTWKRAVPVHLLSSLLLVAGVEAAMSALKLRRDLLVQRPGPPRELRAEGGEGDAGARREEREPHGPPLDPMQFAWLRFADRARISLPVYWMLVAAVQAVAQHRRGIERERRALQAEAHLAEARLLALQTQLNPHFLFNTLNTIAHLVFENPEAAEDMIASLSSLLRAVLEVQDRREVTLEEELVLVQRYWSIQRMRFGERLAFQTEIDPTIEDSAVPTLLLQPLVENALRHGVPPEAEGGRVIVRARPEGPWLQLEVADSGRPGAGHQAPAGPPLVFREGIGLSNTRARLAALYGGRQAFTLEHAPEGGVLARIRLPLRRLAPSSHP